MGQYKYYFKKPRSEIVKDALFWLVAAGVISLVASSPYFISSLTKSFIKGKKYQKKKAYDAFYNLYRQGFLNVDRRNHEVNISLTERGKKKAGHFQIDSLKIKKPKKWDRKWRIVIFDIAELKIIERNAFRGKLQELGFRYLQKSVWCCPYPCIDEISLLRDFFGLTKQDVRIILAENIEGEDSLRERFNIK